ncbi:MAG: transposase [Polyangiaceae bacterium]|nr:transposase [Polyangiaceae bacterium]
MLLLADVVRRHGPAYRERFGAAVLPSHARALDDIARCRTAALGGHLAVCSHCDQSTSSSTPAGTGRVPAAARTRPRAGSRASAGFSCPCPTSTSFSPSRTSSAARSARTSEPSSVPSSAQPSRPWLRSPATTISSAPQIGALAVLHTWTRTLEWHPTSTCSSPLGAGSGWPHLAPAPEEKAAISRTCPRPRQALPRPVFALARRALPGVPLPPIPWEKRWVVFAKPVAHGAEKVLEYLGRYVHRTAMSDRALLAMDDRSVTLRYRDSRDRRHKVLTLPADEMLRRFLQHVPPRACTVSAPSGSSILPNAKPCGDSSCSWRHVDRATKSPPATRPASGPDQVRPLRSTRAHARASLRARLGDERAAPHDPGVPGPRAPPRAPPVPAVP